MVSVLGGDTVSISSESVEEEKGVVVRLIPPVLVIDHPMVNRSARMVFLDFLNLPVHHRVRRLYQR